MASIISITDNIHIFYKKFFQEFADDIAGEPYIILGFVYCVDEEIAEHTIIESRYILTDCNPSSLRAVIQENEPISLNALVNLEDAEIIRKKIADFFASLVSDCVGVEGLKMLHVDVIVEFNQEEEDDASMESDDVEFLGERRMNLLQKNIYMGSGTDEKENEVCAICLNEMRVGETVVCTPCIHQFHDACIGRWFERKGFCLLCRFKIDTFL